MKKLLVIGFIFLVQSSIAQDFDKIKDFLTIYPNKAKVEKDSTLYLSKIITSPVVTFAPETSLGIGIGSKYLFKFKGSGEETRTSNMPASIRYTLKNQFIFFSGFEVFTNQEKWVITGNLLFQNFPRFFYGIGRDTSKDNEEDYGTYQFLFEPLILKKVFTDFLYVGAGPRYNRIYNVEFEEGGIIDAERYSGYNGSTSVGMEVGLLYDDRDNILNASRGWFFKLTRGFYGDFLGGSNDFNLTRFDLRHYISLNQSKRDIVAFQFLGSFSNGNVPFAELALLGGSEIMRGYREGRYVDNNLLAGQIEYRKLFKNSRWGVVGFIGGGDVFNQASQLKLNTIRPNVGVGVRFMIDKEERLNLRGDWGFGDASNHLYFTISDAF